MVFFCGVIPSAMTWSWLIVDSTVLCCNLPATSTITNICGCKCVQKGKLSMVYPMGIACILRLFLYLSVFGYSIHHDLTYSDDEFITDNVFFFLLSWGIWDCGPMVLLTVDWWFYYGPRQDMNGLFGVHLYPMRCVAGQSTMLALASWAFVLWFDHYGNDSVEFILPWYDSTVDICIFLHK